MRKAGQGERFENAVIQQLQPTMKGQPALPPGLQRKLGVFDAMAAMSDLCKLNGIKLLQDLKAWCLDNQVNWEQFCDEHLPKCRRTIDRYLDTLDTFGDGSYEGVVALTTQAELIEARRLYKAGTIRQDGGEIVIGRKRILNDAEHAYQIIEALREAFAHAETAEAELSKEKELRQQQHSAAEEIMKNHRELINKLRAENAHMKAYPTPIHGATEADRQRYPQVQAQFHEIDFACDRLAAINLEDGHSRGFWRELGHTVSRIKDRLCDLEREVADAHPDAYDPVWPYVPDPATMLPAGQQAERMLRDVVDGDGAGA